MKAEILWSEMKAGNMGRSKLKCKFGLIVNIMGRKEGKDENEM
jgi:hypothetical protein